MKSFLQIKGPKLAVLKGEKLTINVTLCPGIFPPSLFVYLLLFEIHRLIPWLLIPLLKYDGDHLILYHSTMSVFPRTS